MNLQEKIAKARQDFADAKPATLDIEVGGELTKLTFLPVWGRQWNLLVAMHPAREGASYDEALGYDTDSVAADYPVDAVTVDGEPVDVETWQSMLSVLSSPGRRRIAGALYGLNHIVPRERLAAAGKASEG